MRIRQFFDKGENQGVVTVGTQSPDPPVVTPRPNMGSFLPFEDKGLMQSIKGTSQWNPPVGSQNLETFIAINEIHLAAQNNNNKRIIQNLSKEEREALKTLSREKEIIIKPADKGGATVIQDTPSYITEARRQLNDTSVYTPLEKDPTKLFYKEVESKINQILENKEITPKMAGSLKVKKPTAPSIYFLPKIHKGTLPPRGGQ